MSNCCGNNGCFISAANAKNLARNNNVIFSEICAIQQAILAATSQCSVNGGQFCTTVSGNTPMTFISSISNITVITPGANYFPIIATAEFFHPNPLNDGANDATADVIVTGGQVTGFSMTALGLNYSPISATTNMTTNGDGLANISVSVNASGIIVGTTILNAGTAYSIGDQVIVVHPSGSGANISVSAIGLLGEILAVTIVAPGSGYQNINGLVVVTHQNGINFSGVLQVSNTGQVTGVSIQNGGVGYEAILPITVIDDITGIGATTLTNVNVLTGAILSVDIINSGSNYSSGVTGIVVAAPTSLGSGASVSVTAIVNPYNTNPYSYYQVVSQQLTNAVIQDQLAQVISYFTQLGYSIQAHVNPSTQSTIQWNVCW